MVSHPSGKTATFGDLLADAARLDAPRSVTLKDPAQFTLIGTDRVRRKDSEAKSNGTARFTQDVHLENMLTAVVAHPPLFGAKVKNFDDVVWKANREKIVTAGSRAKFTQNADLLALLLATKGTTLVEASPYDRIWGIGLAATSPKAQDPKTWRGQNLLGKILTQLRDELLAVQ